MDQQGAQVDVTAFADPEERGLATAGVLPRHEAEPGRYLPAVVEAPGVGNGGDQCSRCERPDARDLLELAAQLGAAVPSEDLVLERRTC